MSKRPHRPIPRLEASIHLAKRTFLATQLRAFGFQVDALSDMTLVVHVDPNAMARLMAELVLLPFNPRFTRDDLAAMLHRSEVRPDAIWILP